MDVCADAGANNHPRDVLRHHQPWFGICPARSATGGKNLVTIKQAHTELMALVAEEQPVITRGILAQILWLQGWVNQAI
jgi:hypothetical protein